MTAVTYQPKVKGAFVVEENGQRIGEMIVDITGSDLCVYHTGVDDAHRNKGIGRQLVDAMAEHARANQLKVTSYCPFVKAILKAEQEKFADIIKE